MMRRKIGIAFLVTAIGSIGVIAQMTPVEKRTDISARVKQHFTLLDTNKDGAVTQAEIDAGRQARRGAMMDDRFKQMDADGNGSVSKEEFGKRAEMRGDRKGKMGGDGRLMGHRGMRGGGMGRGMGGGMGAMDADANKDGKVTEAEMLSQALTRFDAVDTNKDGQISQEERQAHRMKLRTSQGGWDQYGRPLGKPTAQSGAQVHGDDGYDRAGAQTPAAPDMI